MSARKNRPGKFGTDVQPTTTPQVMVAKVSPSDLAKRPAAPLTVSDRRVVYTSQSH